MNKESVKESARQDSLMKIPCVYLNAPLDSKTIVSEDVSLWELSVDVASQYSISKELVLALVMQELILTLELESARHVDQTVSLVFLQHSVPLVVQVST